VVVLLDEDSLELTQECLTALKAVNNKEAVDRFKKKFGMLSKILNDPIF
jgi:hypothetical protein